MIRRLCATAALFIYQSVRASCTGETGTVEIPWMVVADEATILAVGSYYESNQMGYKQEQDRGKKPIYADTVMERHIGVARPGSEELGPQNHHLSGDSLEKFYEEYMKKYLEEVFMEINAKIAFTNVQVVPKFTLINKGANSDLKGKYCVYNTNIAQIANAYLKEARAANGGGDSGQNYLLIINCHGNNPVLPSLEGVASDNGCGHVLGLILVEAQDLEKAIVSGILKILQEKRTIAAMDALSNLETGVCSLATTCAAKYTDFSKLVLDLKSTNSPFELNMMQRKKNEIIRRGPHAAFVHAN